MLRHFALFLPVLYILFGEVFRYYPSKMRLKLKSLLMLTVAVSLIALYGYQYRGSVERSKDSKRYAVQGGEETPLVAKIEDKQPVKLAKEPRIMKDMKETSHDGVPKKKKSKSPKSETKPMKPKQQAVKFKKKFPDPINLKPDPNAPVRGVVGQEAHPRQPGGAGGQAGQNPNNVPNVQQPIVPQKVAQPPPHQPPVAAKPPGQQERRPNDGRIPVQKPLPEAPKVHAPQQGLHGNEQKQEVRAAGDAGKHHDDSVINLSVVCCGDRTDETLVMLKSATILAKSQLHFHIFAEDNLQPEIARRLNTWPGLYRRKFNFNLHPISFPPGEDPEKWKKVFKLCATQRLFLPDILPDVDSLLYVDTDILFIRPIDEIYSFFKKFNSTQFAAMTPEHEIKNIGWYNRFAQHPYYGETGMNSGVMLMNLTRMRKFGWTQKIVPYYHEYKLKIPWGDQDLINVLFHFHPEGLYPYTCEWNYRPDHCMYSNNCHRIQENGIAVIHGNRGVYHNEKQLAFRAIFESFRDYQFGADLESGLVQPLMSRLSQTNVVNTYCAKSIAIPVTTTLKKYASQVVQFQQHV